MKSKKLQKDDTKIYKHVQISPEYHEKLGHFALEMKSSRKKIVESLIEKAIAENEKRFKREDLLCLN